MMPFGLISTMQDRACFEMRFSPCFELVVPVRRFVSALTMRVLVDPMAASRVALATHELLDNAVKYAVDGEAQFSMMIARPGARPIVEIRTRNRCPGLHASVLSSRIAEMNSHRDPFEFYQSLMRRQARTKVTGGLGLGRVASEADMKLSCEVDEEHITVIARSPQGEEVR